MQLSDYCSSGSHTESLEMNVQKEILENLEILTSPVLELKSLTLAGVGFDASTADFPRTKITEVTLSPIVFSSRSGTDIEPEYFDSQGHKLSLEEVVDSVLDDGGIVHFKDALSFKIVGGTIAGFAIYGAQLNHFSTVNSYEECVRRFGRPDHEVVNEAYGDLMGYDLYYYGARKQVSWDSFRQRVSLINLGDYEGNDRIP
jgi:hypothetical protein